MTTPAVEVGYDALAPFFDGGFVWEGVRLTARQFRALIAVDDPVLTPDPIDHARLYTSKLGAKVLLTPECVHFSRLRNRTELHEAVTLVNEILPDAR
ncbi:hypothetical protein [Streptomyces litchfieldiae]|uniref:hypothetical protein n=1 Tax=Streptomyces litchfieldiae TaxID=3075543 RepID=UPI00374E1DD6